MMFSGIYPERDGALEVLANRLKQAAAAEMPQVLTFGHTQGGNRKILGRGGSRSWDRSRPTWVCC